ncbi:MAG TPA: thioredoxin family protein [Opitutaceae bacterium]|jgi:thiol:disulfide interchange protein
MTNRGLKAVLVLATLALLPPVHAQPEYPAMGPDLYDVHANGSAQIARALSDAARTHRRVLVDFGANWCIWCRRLHSTFEGDGRVSEELKRDFVVVLVDVNTRRGEKRNADVVERYGNPVQHGIPVLVVLDPDGRQLTTKDTGELENGEGHSPGKILAFLAEWAPRGHP